MVISGKGPTLLIPSMLHFIGEFQCVDNLQHRVHLLVHRIGFEEIMVSDKEIVERLITSRGVPLTNGNKKVRGFVTKDSTLSVGK